MGQRNFGTVEQEKLGTRGKGHWDDRTRETRNSQLQDLGSGSCCEPSRGRVCTSALVLPVEIKPQRARKEGCGTGMERDVGDKGLQG